MINLLSKIVGLKSILLLAIGAAIGTVATLKITKSIKPIIELTCPEQKCDCPEPLPCNGIDFEKIKGKSITLHNTQYITSRDTVIDEKLRTIIQEELNKLRISKCK